MPLFFFPLFGIKLEAYALRTRSTQQRTHLAGKRLLITPNTPHFHPLQPSLSLWEGVLSSKNDHMMHPHKFECGVLPTSTPYVSNSIARRKDSLRKSCDVPRVALGCLCCTPIRATRRRLFAQMRSERNGRLSQRPLPPSFAPSQVREFVFDVKSAHRHTHLLLAHPSSPLSIWI